MPGSALTRTLKSCDSRTVEVFSLLGRLYRASREAATFVNSRIARALVKASVQMPAGSAVGPGITAEQGMVSARTGEP